MLSTITTSVTSDPGETDSTFVVVGNAKGVCVSVGDGVGVEFGIGVELGVGMSDGAPGTVFTRVGNTQVGTGVGWIQITGVLVRVGVGVGGFRVGVMGVGITCGGVPVGVGVGGFRVGVMGVGITCGGVPVGVVVSDHMGGNIIVRGNGKVAGGYCKGALGWMRPGRPASPFEWT